MNYLSFGGELADGKAFAYYETIAGGMGASAKGDGYSATHTHMTNSWNTPVEAFEHQYPVRIESYSVRKNSGGRGAHSGGDFGIVREFRFPRVPRRLPFFPTAVCAGRTDLRAGKQASPDAIRYWRRGRKPQTLPAKDAVD